jgi:CPA1 family monovalent cation:H+ antiporter
MVGNYGRRIGMSPTTRVSVGDFWEYATFVVNSVIFLLIGLEVKAGHFAEFFLPVVVAIILTLLGRSLGVGVSSVVINRFFEPLESRWTGVLIWGGLRGSLSMALALSLPSGFPGRQLILTMVFGVVAFSLLFQGFTMKPLLRSWGLIGSRPERLAFEMKRGRLLGKQKAKEELSELENRGFITHETARMIRPDLEQEIESLRETVSEHFHQEDLLRNEEAVHARRRLWDAEKQAVKDAFRDGVLSEESTKEIISQIEEEKITFSQVEEKKPTSSNGEEE